MRSSWTWVVAEAGSRIGHPLPQNEGEQNALVPPAKDVRVYQRLKTRMSWSTWGYVANRSYTPVTRRTEAVVRMIAAHGRAHIERQP